MWHSYITSSTWLRLRQVVLAIWESLVHVQKLMTQLPKPERDGMIPAHLEIFVMDGTLVFAILDLKRLMKP